MFYQHSNGSSSLPRGFRFRHEEDQPRTPEPLAADEPQPPSPPRPAPRLKIRRRNGMPNFEAPTETFLASVTAADVPIPTIEVPQSLAEDSDMPDREAISITTTGLLAPSTFNYRLVSPPKTPVPMLSAEEEIQRPDWSRGASSEPEYFERPMSASSNLSDFSDDSFYDGVSRPSDDGSCTSPESDISDPFQFPSVFKSKNQDTIPPYLKSAQSQNAPLNAKLRSKTRSDAPWSKAMSEHLWQTYLIYLQDPTVTPFRIGASAVPPEGVCHRVAREAKRSWKGPKLAVPTTTIRRSARLNLAVREPLHDTDKSGSITPTGETIPKVYGQWPHSSVATRNHLRELCKTKDSTSVSRHRYFQTRSPTPFTKSRITHSRLRTPEPDQCAGAFNTHDIGFSLATSTAESMQPDGPLAKLAIGDGSCDMETNPSLVWQEENRARRLGSPFIARTYGPSSSKPMSERPRPPRTRSDTVAAIPSLRSPLRFDNSRFDKTRSLNSTQKRRAANALDEEDIIRPSILNDQLFGGHLRDQRRVRSRGFSLGDEALRHCAPGLFQHAFSGVDSLPQGNTISTIPEPSPSESTATPSLLPSATFDSAGSQGIPRLRSPFSESVSNTFPRRLFQDGVVNPNHIVKRSAFATMHQTRRSIESFDFGEGPSLQSRLSQLDNKLAEIRRLEATSRRTGS